MTQTNVSLKWNDLVVSDSEKQQVESLARELQWQMPMGASLNIEFSGGGHEVIATGAIKGSADIIEAKTTEKKQALSAMISLSRELQKKIDII